MATLMITGANRGIGLELTRQYAAAGDRVHACCRTPAQATALASLAADHDNVSIHQLDVTCSEQIAAVKQETEGPIDVLINNAGVMVDGRGRDMIDADGFLVTMAANAYAPLAITHAFADRLAESDRKVMAIITSRMGSVADNTSGGYHAYRASKAAVNMVGKTLSIDLRSREIACVLLHPGWVKTD
ncbi:MAG: SDR family oxidoreductase, partial [Planctomycetota bacterium]